MLRYPSIIELLTIGQRYQEGKSWKIPMERSRRCSFWGTCSLVRGAKEAKKRGTKGYYNCTVQLMEHVRGKLVWNALPFVESTIVRILTVKLEGYR